MAGAWAALAAFLLGVFKTIFDGGRDAPLTKEARRTGAAEAELKLKAQSDAQVAETTKAVDGLGSVLVSPDRLRDYAEHDPNNRDTWPNSDNAG